MLITCLNNKLGYEKCAEIAKKAYKNNSTLKEESKNWVTLQIKNLMS